MSPIWLNVSTLSDSHSLFVSLTSPLILGQDHLNKIPFWAFANSRSTHCFVDFKFVNTHHLKISATPLVALHLFDGPSNSNISKIANLPIIFPIGDCINLDFYVTPLDYSYSLVLGYNWLAWHNPLIDWVNRLINFHLSLQENLTLSCVMANTSLASPLFLDISLQSLDSMVSIPAFKTSMSNSRQPNIAIIGDSCMHQNSWTPTISNFVFTLQTFGLIPQNLQKLPTFPMSLLSIMNLLTFSAKLKLKFSLFIILMTSKSIWKKMLNLWLAYYTLFWYLNKRL